jgi:hypothetical protein
MKKMKAVVFKEKNRIAIEEVLRPVLGAGEAVIRLRQRRSVGPTSTSSAGSTRCGRDWFWVTNWLASSRARAGLERLHRGQRVIVGAITLCGQCFYCLNGSHSQCGGALGGWRFGNTINGAWAEYLLVPDARSESGADPFGAGRRRRAALSGHLFHRPVGR